MTQEFIARLGNVLVFALFLCLFSGFMNSVSGQTAEEPERQQLLNGLRILIWPKNGDQSVLLKLRIHSGAAFDLGGKAGEMSMLGEILFPDVATHEYFTEEMQGHLNVTTDYDSMTITMRGRASEFERIVEILRTALVTPQLTPENIARIRDRRIKLVKETSISPTIVADRTIATRLFGDFPYGRPYTGSPESLARVDRSDLMLARERFLNPNNATLAIVGGVQTNRIMRTLRQLLGVWRKSERIVPATFRQPEAPDPRTLIINAPSDQSVEIRVATRGLAASDPDAAAADILAVVARERWKRREPELAHSPVFARHEPHVLPGMFVMGATVNLPLVAKTLGAARSVLQSLVNTPVSASELQQAVNEHIGAATQQLAKPEGLAEAWLNMDTYKLASPAEQIEGLRRVSADHVQKTADRLFHDSAIASAAVGTSDQLKSQLEPQFKVEVLGELKPTSEPNSTQPDQRATTGPTTKPD